MLKGVLKKTNVQVNNMFDPQLDQWQALTKPSNFF